MAGRGGLHLPWHQPSLQKQTNDLWEEGLAPIAYQKFPIQKCQLIYCINKPKKISLRKHVRNLESVMEPIPLRGLTVLLNYERTVSDPRFEGTLLLNSSIVDTSLLDALTAMEREK